MEMKKYEPIRSVVKARLYEKGMEDGWEICYFYEDRTTLDSGPVAYFKTIEDAYAEIERLKKESPNPDKLDIYGPDPIVIIDEVEEEIFDDEYLIINEKGEKEIMHKKAFEKIFKIKE